MADENIKINRVNGIPIEDTELKNNVKVMNNELTSQINEKASDIDLSVERSRIDNLVKLEDNENGYNLVLDSTNGDNTNVDIQNTVGNEIDSLKNEINVERNRINSLSTLTGDFVKTSNKLINILPDISNRILGNGVDNLSYTDGIITFTPNVGYGSCLIRILNNIYIPKPGDNINISCYVKCAHPDSSVKFRIYECDSLGHTITQASGNNIKTVLNEYTLLSETFTISTECNHLLIGIGNDGEVYSEVSVKKIMFIKTGDLTISEDDIKILGGYWDDKPNCADQSLYSCKSYSLDSNYESELMSKINNSTNSKWKNKTWYCIGDSIMNQKGIQPLVQNQLGIGTVINDCVSGQLLKTMVDRVNSNTLNGVDLVTVHCTTNDYKRTPLGQKGDTTTDTFYGAVYNAINKIYSANNKVKLVFIISHRVGDNQYFPNYGEANEVGKYQYEYGDAVKDVCKDYGVPVLDMYTNSGINKYNFSLYTADNVHLSTDGFKLYRDMMCPFLNSI